MNSFHMTHGLVVTFHHHREYSIVILFRSLDIANGSQLQYQSYSSTGPLGPGRAGQAASFPGIAGRERHQGLLQGDRMEIQ